MKYELCSVRKLQDPKHVTFTQIFLPVSINNNDHNKDPVCNIKSLHDTVATTHISQTAYIQVSITLQSVHR